MTLIKSISGIRGTIGGTAGENLTPPDIVRFTAAYGSWLREQQRAGTLSVVVGRDARLSGAMVNALVCATLEGLGINVIDLGITTTPTVELAVPAENAAGGIVLTASHNPVQWNALKLLNDKGEFISAADGARVLELADAADLPYAPVHELGKTISKDYLAAHLEAISALDLVNAEAIRNAGLVIAVDAVNSSGGIYVPALLHALGVQSVHPLWCDPTGHFPHNPEPLPEHLTALADAVRAGGCHLGISVDPDVDRLALVCEDGTMFGEEYTLVAVADYVLRHTPGNTVSNLSSTRALRDVTLAHGRSYSAAAVGEVNVVAEMKRTGAVIGGEGNGGIIYPELHYGRDALVGIALFLTHLAKFGKTASVLRATYPNYYISKNKIELTPEIDVDGILSGIQTKYKKHPINTIDGVKIEFEREWVHLRKSNTEPIIRIYAESQSQTTAQNLAEKIIHDIKDMISENHTR